MEKFVNKGFDTLNELTSFLNSKGITKDNIVYIGPDVKGNGYVLVVTK